jgi:hypothetical protein
MKRCKVLGSYLLFISMICLVKSALAQKEDDFYKKLSEDDLVYLHAFGTSAKVQNRNIAGLNHFEIIQKNSMSELFQQLNDLQDGTDYLWLLIFNPDKTGIAEALLPCVNQESLMHQAKIKLVLLSSSYEIQKIQTLFNDINYFDLGYILGRESYGVKQSLKMQEFLSSWPAAKADDNYFNTGVLHVVIDRQNKLVYYSNEIGLEGKGLMQAISKPK